MKLRYLAFFLIILVSLSSALTAQRPIRDLKPTVILISLDGFRYDYLDKFQTPAMQALAHDGVRAKWMIPSFPTKTFPNHYTIVTGLYPEHHGIVENNVWDFGSKFMISDNMRVEEPRWWWGEPIWVTAEKQGQHSASYFWPGSNTKIDDILPSVTRRYNGKVPNEMRVDKLLEWFDKPVKDRPTMFTLYFSDTDDAGHEFGPDAEETRYAALDVDTDIARLMAGLKRRGIDRQVNVIIVSDHGMAAVDQRNSIVMDDVFDIKDTKIADPILKTGEIWQIFPKAGKEDWIMDRLTNIRHSTCWRKKDIPERLHYNEGSRVAPIICSSDEGWYMVDRERLDKDKEAIDFPAIRGAHGYDNRYESMRATFIGHGAAFKRGVVAEPFPNIDVYELMCRILNLKPAKNDGDLSRVKAMLR
jgi:predicted AlkP superfamily pyrophosphatase or phosphodiesterase